MSTSGSWRVESQKRLEALLSLLDERLAPRILARFRQVCEVHPLLAIPDTANVVLVGHRAAGKSRILPLIAQILSRPGVDLDREIERKAGRPLRRWLTRDEWSFRDAERAVFSTLGHGKVIAVGGGFLSLHPDLLVGQMVVEVPVTFEGYRGRLMGDTSRPRLRPSVSIETEIRELYLLREREHAKVARWSLPELLARLPPQVDERP